MHREGWSWNWAVNRPEVVGVDWVNYFIVIVDVVVDVIVVDVGVYVVIICWGVEGRISIVVIIAFVFVVIDFVVRVLFVVVLVLRFFAFNLNCCQGHFVPRCRELPVQMIFASGCGSASIEYIFLSNIRKTCFKVCGLIWI